jgi:hypothetical protein
MITSRVVIIVVIADKIKIVVVKVVIVARAFAGLSFGYKYPEFRESIYVCSGSLKWRTRRITEVD